MHNLITALNIQSAKLRLTKYLTMKPYQLKEKDRLRNVALKLVGMGVYSCEDFYRFCDANELLIF